MIDMRTIFFDIETRNIFAEVRAQGGKGLPEELDISVISIYDTKTKKFSSFVQEELGELWKILEDAECMVGYNSKHFDLPLLNKYYAGNLNTIKQIDLLEEIQNSIGRRLKLDDVAEATLGHNKTSHGLQAVDWWKEYAANPSNREPLENIIKYCEADVALTKELYDYGLKNKKFVYKDWGKEKDIPLDTKHWKEKEEEAVMNRTLF
jgi:3''-5'' exonuclease.